MNILRKFSPSKKDILKSNQSDSEIDCKGESPSKRGFLKRYQSDSKVQQKKGMSFLRKKLSRSFTMSLSDGSVAPDSISLDQSSFPSSTTEEKICIEDNGSLDCESVNSKQQEQVTDGDSTTTSGGDPVLTEVVKNNDYKEDRDEMENLKQRELSIIEKDLSEKLKLESPEGIVEQRETYSAKEDNSREMNEDVEQHEVSVVEKDLSEEPKVKSSEDIVVQHGPSITGKDLSKDLNVGCLEEGIKQPEISIAEKDSSEELRVESSQDIAEEQEPPTVPKYLPREPKVEGECSQENIDEKEISIEENIAENDSSEDQSEKCSQGDMEQEPSIIKNHVSELAIEECLQENAKQQDLFIAGADLSEKLQIEKDVEQQEPSIVEKDLSEETKRECSQDNAKREESVAIKTDSFEGSKVECSQVKTKRFGIIGKILKVAIVLLIVAGFSHMVATAAGFQPPKFGNELFSFTAGKLGFISNQIQENTNEVLSNQIGQETDEQAPNLIRELLSKLQR